MEFNLAPEQRREGGGVYNETVYNPPHDGEQPFYPSEPPVQLHGSQHTPHDQQPFINNNPRFVPREKMDVREIEPQMMDCQPEYCYSPWGVLRFLELLIGIVVLACFTVTCNSSACVVYMNEFGRVAQGLGYCVFASMLTIALMIVLIVMYSTNMHRAQTGLVLAVERAIFAFSIFLLIIEAIVLAYYSSVSFDDSALYDLSRAKWGGIQPSWIAACVLCWINVILYMGDLIGQCAFGYPTRAHVNC